MPAEWKKYAATDKPNSENEGGEGGDDSEPGPVKPSQVPPKPEPSSGDAAAIPVRSDTSSPPVPHQSPTAGENQNQMERRGGESREEKDTSLRSVAPQRACRLPDNWQPSADDRAYAEGLGLNAAAVAENFRAYWHAKTGQAATKAGTKGWTLTWQVWCRREVERHPQAARQPASGKPFVDRAKHNARLAEIERELMRTQTPEPPEDFFAGQTIEGTLQ
jgi:hypothetical protein